MHIINVNVLISIQRTMLNYSCFMPLNPLSITVEHLFRDLAICLARCCILMSIISYFRLNGFLVEVVVG